MWPHQERTHCSVSELQNTTHWLLFKLSVDLIEITKLAMHG